MIGREDNAGNFVFCEVYIKCRLYKVGGFVYVKGKLLIVDFCNLRKQNQGIF